MRNSDNAPLLAAGAEHVTADERPVRQRPGPNHFRTVLVAVDGEPASLAAWRAATDLAVELGAKLVLLHVIDVLPFINVTADPADDDSWTLRRAQAERLLADVQSTYPATIPVREVIRLGEPRQGIISTAREWQADLVVVGSHQRLPLLDAMMGGTAAYVERHLKCPVVLVPEICATTPAARG